MERCIPHVIDVFECSPGARRRGREQIETELKSPSSDSAVSLGSSDEDGEEKNISKYFDYLDNHDSGGEELDISSTTRDENKNQNENKNKNNVNCDNKATKNLNNKNIPDDKIKQFDVKNNNVLNNARNIKNLKSEKSNTKADAEKDFRHIERHLSMKKTIRKKMMKDLQHAFVEDPNDLKLDPKDMTKQTKNHININNLTYRKKNLSKSEHNFLNMLKDDSPKDKMSVTKSLKEKLSDKKSEITTLSKEKKTDVDSGCEDPTRDTAEREKLNDARRKDAKMTRCKSKEDLLASPETNKPESNKKSAFWNFFSGKKKAKPWFAKDIYINGLI